MQFSWTTYVFEVVNFLLFLWLLQRLVYAPITNAIATRRQAQTQAEQRVEDLTKEAKKLQLEQTEQRKQLSRLREEVLAEAREEAQAERAALLGQAKDETLDLRRREAERIHLEQRQIAAESVQSSLQAARHIAELVLGRLGLPAVDTALQRALFAEIERKGAPAMPAAAGSTQRSEDVPTGSDRATPLSEHPVCLFVARDLTAEQETEVQKKLDAVLGSTVDLRVEQQPRLIAGLKLQVGNQVYDASLLAQLDHLFADASRELGVELPPTEPIQA